MRAENQDCEQICPLCERELGQKSEKHHIIPKSKGGTETVLVHPICHRKIHKVFTRAQLAKMTGGIEALKDNEEIAKFILWLKGKPPDFYRRTR